MLTIKQTAELLDISEHTIRFYTDKGLVPGLDRDSNNHRLFNEKSLNWLRGAINLRNSGMSLSSVKYYIDLCVLGEETIPLRLELLREQKKLADENLRLASQSVDFLSRKLSIYEESLKKGEDALNPGTWGSKT